MVFLGIDIGTSSAKTLAVDELGNILGRGQAHYPLLTPEIHCVEQMAEDWWVAVIESVHLALANIQDTSDVCGIGISTQGATMLAIDSKGNPLCNAITWMDTRSKSEAAELASSIGENTIYQKTGWTPNPSLDAAKIAWMRKNNSDLFCKSNCFVTTAEYITLKLTGRNIIDPTNAAIRQLMNVKTLDWDFDILSFLGIDASMLPEILPSGIYLGSLTKQAALDLGLPHSVAVFNGAHDQYCAAIGSGVHSSGDVLVATGTAWVVFSVTDTLLQTNTKLSPGFFPLTGKYAALASFPSAGSSMEWWKSVSETNYFDLDNEAKNRRNSAANLFFFPYLAGSGSMHADKLSGTLSGLTLSHDKYDIALALMEGVVFETKLLMEEFLKSGIFPNRLLISGGAINSPLWSQLIANIMGFNALKAVEKDAAGLGAAMLSAVGCGAFPSLYTCSETMVKLESISGNDKSIRKFYENKFNLYLDKLEFLKESF